MGKIEGSYTKISSSVPERKNTTKQVMCIKFLIKTPLNFNYI